jgi:hypothetical protein
VAQVEEVAHPGSYEKEEDEDEPGVLVPVRDREVVRDHGEHDGQRQVVVVNRALLPLQGERRIRIPPRALGADELPVRRDDDEEDVSGHHRSEHRADLDVDGARAEDLADREGEADDEGEDGEREGEIAPPEQAAEDLVHEPASNEHADADPDRRRRADVGHAPVDQVDVGFDVVEDDEKREPAEPGRVGLPLEPEQPLGEPLGDEPVLLDVVEAAAVDLPGLAGDSALGVPVIPWGE